MPTTPRRSAPLVLSTLLLAGLCLAAVVGSSSASATTPSAPTGAAVGPRPSAVVASDWTTFDHDGQRTGVDTSGNSFAHATAAWTSATLDGQLYGQPLVAGGRVFTATENDTVYALAADSGAVLWSKHLGTPLTPSNVPGLCGNIQPTVGITGTPVIDPGRAEIFVVATIATAHNAVHRLVGLDLYTGNVLLNEAVDPPGASPAFQLQRVSLGLTDGRVIIGFGGNAGDCEPYHGLVVSAPEDGSPPATFTVANQPGDGQGAVWMGGAGPSIDAHGNVWVATGNSEHHSSADAYDQSDSVLELSPNMQLLQSFAPHDWYTDNNNDLDLGSGAPALLPNGLVFEVGKSQTAYVLSQAHLGGIGGQVASTNGFCFSDGGSADLNGTLFVPCSNGIHSVTVTSSAPAAHWTTSSGAHGSPIVAGGEVWSIGNGTLYALDAATGAELQHSPRRRPPTAWCWHRLPTRSMPSSVRPACPVLRPPPRPAPATGLWPATAGSSATAVPPISAPPDRSPSTDRWSGSPPPPITAATGWWPATAASSPSVTPASTDRPARWPSTGPSSAWPPPLPARATGWWPVTAASSPSVMPPSTDRPARSP